MYSEYIIHSTAVLVFPGTYSSRVQGIPHIIHIILRRQVLPGPRFTEQLQQYTYICHIYVLRAMYICMIWYDTNCF